MSSRKTTEILGALERIDFFGRDNAQLAAELPVTVELFAANKTNIEQLHAAGITSDAATAGGLSRTRSKAARARSIKSDLRRVARAARIIERKKPGDFENVFDVPRGDLKYQDVIDKANSFIARRQANKADFDRYGLNDQFFADLQEDVAELNEATEGQADAKRTGVGATADIEATVENALDIREELKTAIGNHYRNDPAKLAEWLAASHIRRTPRANDDNKPPAPPAPE